MKVSDGPTVRRLGLTFIDETVTEFVLVLELMHAIDGIVVNIEANVKSAIVLALFEEV